MPGVKGAGGPVPKRSDQRRRRNKAQEPTKAPAGGDGGGDERKPHSRWHPIAKRLYLSAAQSGQASFYEESDWATLYLLCESIDRELKPQIVGMVEGEPVTRAVPPKGASLAAWSKLMTSLLFTEGDRRRAQLELQRPGAEGGEEVAGVSELEEYRRRIHGEPAR